MDYFSVDVEEIKMPKAATPQLRRVQIGWNGRPLTDLTQGIFRAYLFPVYSPAGVPLTAESPVDHPHHNSVVVGADVFCVQLPPLLSEVSTLAEEATYNLYVNQVFQGRAPGRIWSVRVESEEISEGHLRVVQTLHWQGPEEWGVEDGRRVLAEETRTMDIYPGEVAHVIDVRSQLRPTEWDIRIGPTRHAYFTIRLADGLRPVAGGTVLDSQGRTVDDDIRGQRADWVDMSGPAAHGQRAGIAVMPHASMGEIMWLVNDWGTITVNPFLRQRGEINRGDVLDLGLRIVAHDGDAEEADVAGLYEVFKREHGV
jgi:hypothetical protein